MGIIGDIIDEYYEHKHRESVSNIENDTEKIIENHVFIQKMFLPLPTIQNFESNILK